MHPRAWPAVAATCVAAALFITGAVLPIDGGASLWGDLTGRRQSLAGRCRVPGGHYFADGRCLA